MTVEQAHDKASTKFSLRTSRVPVFLLILALCSLTAGTADGIRYSLQIDVLLSDLSEPEDIDFTPDGHLLVACKQGTIWLAKPGADNPATPFLQLSNLDSSYANGLLGIALDPDFARNGYFYVYYTAASPLRERVSRFRAHEKIALLESETVLWEDPVAPGPYHHGGAIAFGPDGKLYIATGDHLNPNDAQSLQSYHGKVLRMEHDGTIPNDNPFFDSDGPNLDAIWAYGLKNPTRISFDPLRGVMSISDFEERTELASIDELNLGVAGANFGWPICEGKCRIAGVTDPVYSFAREREDALLTGGFVYRGNQFPLEHYGHYLLGDYARGAIRSLPLETGKLALRPDIDLEDLRELNGQAKELKAGPDGSLYYLVSGNEQPGALGTGILYRIRYVSENQPPLAMAIENPSAGPAPLTVRFSSLGSRDPEGQPLTYRWQFGDGTTSTVPDPSHTYLNSGAYVATLSVSDGTYVSLSRSIWIQVAEYAPGRASKLDTVSPASLHQGAISPSYSTTRIANNGGFALRFYGNGTNDIDRVKIPIDAPSRLVDVGLDFTLEFWMKAHPTANSSTPISPGGDNWINGNIIFDRDIYGPGDDGDFGISLAGYRIAFGVDSFGSGNTIYGSTQLNDDGWHHIAVTREASGGLLGIFVDGVLDASGVGPTGDISYRHGRSSGFPNSDPYLVIGAEKHDAGPGYPSYNGVIDEVRISSIVRYTTNFTRPAAPFVTDASTVALYHFNEGSGSVASDVSGVSEPSNGELRIGGLPQGPEWVLSYAPLAGSGNQPPSVSAGADQSIVLPNAANLDGTVTDDGLPNPPGTLTTTWSQVSGPGSVTFGSSSAVDTTASFSMAGTYVLRLTANDGALSASDDVTITVNPSGLAAVAAYALNEGFGTTTADASGNGSNATLFGPSWIAGRFGNALAFDGIDDYISTPDNNSFDITEELTLEAWIYPFVLNSYRVIVAKTTTGEPSNYYVGTKEDELSFGFYTNGWREHTSANANLQINTWYHVAAVFNDAANSVRLYVNGVEVHSSPETDSLTVNNETLRIGIGFSNEVFNGVIDEVRIYRRALSQGEIQADMNPPGGGNLSPSVNAGTDQSITLPNTANLDGTVTDDGLPNPPGVFTTSWSRLSGPGTVTFGDSSAIDTTASFSATGTYVLRLTANDGALSASDDVTVTVTVTSQNQPPSVNAGPDQSVTLPNAANLDGTVSDDGLPNPPGAVTTSWSRVSGPGTVSFGSSSAVDTTATFSMAGTYVLRLTANDGALSAGDDCTITVGPSGPVAVAAYALDEGFGTTAADASGNGNNASLLGPSWTAGRFGNALSFDGTDDYISIPDGNSLDIADELTLEAWIYPFTLNSYRIIVAKTTTGEPSNYYLATTGDELTFGFYTNGWREHTTANVNLQTNTWYHVAAVFNDAADSIRLYLNGVEVLFSSEANSLTVNNETLRIGIGFSAEVFNGIIDEVRIYNRALTQEQIQADMNRAIAP